jgi:hypothetical protein
VGPLGLPIVAGGPQLLLHGLPGRQLGPQLSGGFGEAGGGGHHLVRGAGAAGGEDQDERGQEQAGQADGARQPGAGPGLAVPRRRDQHHPVLLGDRQVGDVVQVALVGVGGTQVGHGRRGVRGCAVLQGHVDQILGVAQHCRAQEVLPADGQHQPAEELPHAGRADDDRGRQRDRDLPLLPGQDIVPDQKVGVRDGEAAAAPGLVEPGDELRRPQGVTADEGRIRAVQGTGEDREPVLDAGFGGPQSQPGRAAAAPACLDGGLLLVAARHDEGDPGSTGQPQHFHRGGHGVEGAHGQRRSSAEAGDGQTHGGGVAADLGVDRGDDQPGPGLELLVRGAALPGRDQHRGAHRGDGEEQGDEDRERERRSHPPQGPQPHHFPRSPDRPGRRSDRIILFARGEN